MLLKFNLPTKFFALLVIYTIVFFIEQFLYQRSLSENSFSIGAGLCIVQAVVLMLFGFFFFQTFKYVRLPLRYYRQREFEKGNFFNYLGVNQFQFILVNSFMRYANPRVYLKGRKREYLKIYHEETKQSETSHLVSLLSALVVQCLYLFNGELVLFIYLTIATVFFNVYPILLQRRNRFSIESRFGAILN